MANKKKPNLSSGYESAEAFRRRMGLKLPEDYEAKPEPAFIKNDPYKHEVMR